MKYTEKQIAERFTKQLDECLEAYNAEVNDYTDKIINVDMENKTITIKFNYYIDEEDDYIGLVSY